MGVDMRLAVAMIGLIALTGCDRAAENAEREYAMAEKAGGKAEKCAAAGRAAEAWLKRGDEINYGIWRSRREVACSPYTF